MKEQQAAVVVLILITLGLAYGTQQMRNKMVDTRQQTESAKLQADESETQRLTVESNLRLLKKDTDDLRAFYRAWLPHFEAVQNPQSGEAKVIDAVKRGGVFSTSQRFENGAGVTETVVPRSLKAKLVFEDEYAKAINWMGELERLLPTARTNGFEVRHADSGNDVHITLELEVPIFDPLAMVIERVDPEAEEGVE